MTYETSSKIGGKGKVRDSRGSTEINNGNKQALKEAMVILRNVPLDDTPALCSTREHLFCFWHCFLICVVQLGHS